MNRASIEVSGGALAHNIDQFRSLLPCDCGIMAVVKANGYGHGAVTVSTLLESIGVDRFGVSTVDEGIELRDAGIKGMILVLGYSHPDRFDDAQKNDLILTATCTEHAEQMEEHGRATDRPLRVHIAVDTGMHRIGFLHDDISTIKKYYDSKSMHVEGIFSHLCVADSDEDEQIAFSHLQAQRYDKALQRLRAAGVNVGDRHLLNSHGAANYPEYAYDYVRLGILMYGARCESGAWVRPSLDLQPVLTLKTRVTSVREITAGESVSYGRTFTATRPTKIASLAIGYADGVPRSLSGGNMRVLIRGEFAQGVGRVCMDQMMVDVTSIDGVQIGDEAIIIGKDGERSITVEELADASGTITDEILTRLTLRIEGRKLVDLR